MKNIFKCKNIDKDASCSSHGLPRTNEVITLASANDGRDSTLQPSVEKPTKKHQRVFCAENRKIAHIFLPRTVNKHGTHVGTGQQKVDLLCHIQLEQQVKILQEAKSSCDTTHRECRHRERLPTPDVTRCVEEIQASNPAFPVCTTFCYLQEKSQAHSPGNTLIFYHCIPCFPLHWYAWDVMLCVYLFSSTFPAHHPAIQFPAEPFRTWEHSEGPQTAEAVPDYWLQGCCGWPACISSGRRGENGAKPPAAETLSTQSHSQAETIECVGTGRQIRETVRQSSKWYTKR